MSDPEKRDVYHDSENNLRPYVKLVEYKITTAPGVVHAYTYLYGYEWKIMAIDKRILAYLSRSAGRYTSYLLQNGKGPTQPASDEMKYVIYYKPCCTLWWILLALLCSRGVFIWRTFRLNEKTIL